MAMSPLLPSGTNTRQLLERSSIFSLKALLMTEGHVAARRGVKSGRDGAGRNSDACSDGGGSDWGSGSDASSASYNSRSRSRLSSRSSGTEHGGSSTRARAPAGPVNVPGVVLDAVRVLRQGRAVMQKQRQQERQQ